jgi:hypothetical protein
VVEEESAADEEGVVKEEGVVEEEGVVKEEGAADEEGVVKEEGGAEEGKWGLGDRVRGIKTKWASSTKVRIAGIAKNAEPSDRTRYPPREAFEAAIEKFPASETDTTKL